MKNIIEVRGLVKDFKNLRAVDHLDLDVKEGRILGLLGPNGSGKSTTINCILALLKKDGGSIKIYGEEMTPESYDIKRKIGVVFQDVGVFYELNVYENIDYFCGLYIKDKAQRRKNIKEVLDLVGLNDFVKYKPKELSGGLLRRLNIACGIAHKPDLIIFDEPTVAVDPQSRNNILEGIKKLNKNGSTIIFTSHYMDEVEELCDDIVIIDQGKTIAKGSVEELKNLIDINEIITFESEDLTDEIIEEIKSLDSYLGYERKSNFCSITFSHGNRNLIKLVEIFNKHGMFYDSLTSKRPSLNDVFLELIGKDLRD